MPFDVIQFFLVFITTVNAGKLCLNCKAVPQPLDCTDVVECGTHESCYTQRFITYDGITLFNVGCRDHDQCKANPARSVGDVNICTRCCNNTDVCNLDQYCSSEAFAPKPGHVLCFSCPYSLVQPTQCHRITLCGQDQQCSITTTRNLLNEERYQMGCSSNKACQGSGLYCCNNQLCNRHIPTKPIIVNPTSNQHIQVKYHTDVRITCIATGYPVPTIGYEFLHTIPFPTNFVRENDNTLLISNYNKENDGSYHCYAVNTIGTAKVEFTIKGT
ncbi:uncharacterized protein LOC143051237 [Mytilus galloprovincialis]|uniref:uncharacterized protein LOC143051237 n=1 Tax=Mytilus galloprovincialis TaxID=29158 RepID=UPI003F7B9D70